MPEIPCPIAVASRHYPDIPALIQADGYLSYSDLDALTAQTVAWLETRHWQRGDRIALLLHNSVEYVVLLAAMFRSGLVACPLSTRIPAATVRQQLNYLQCRAVMTDRAYLLSGLSDIEVVALTELSLEDPAEGGDVPMLQLEQPVTILFTSGTSGAPKAALHPYASHYYNAMGSGENIPVGPGALWLLSLPLFHVGGLSILFRTWLGGGAMVIPESSESLAETIGKYGITHVSLVATQLYRLLVEETNVDLRSLSHVLLGGSAIPQRLVELAVKRGVPIHTSYGLTEMGSQVTTTALADIPGKLASSGKSLTYREVTISEIGEILVRGECLFAGYVTAEQIDAAIDSTGWFHTGDIGYLDSAGYLYVSGRKDNMFVSGGENIHPEEIEEALANLSEVAQAVVVPVDHPEYGHRPVAFVQMANGHDLRAEAIRARLARSLPRFKLPDRIYPWPEELVAGMKPNRAYFSRLAASLTDFTG